MDIIVVTAVGYLKKSSLEVLARFLKLSITRGLLFMLVLFMSLAQKHIFIIFT